MNAVTGTGPGRSMDSLVREVIAHAVKAGLVTPKTPGPAPFEAWRYPGTLQWPMTVEQQKAAGLIATESRSIHPKNWSKAAPRARRDK